MPQTPEPPAASAQSGRRVAVLGEAFHPRYVVWELTLRCDLACRHCGSRAGRARADELQPEEALELADQLVAAGTQELTLIGGEAYLRPDWLAVVARLTQGGVRVGLTTGGRGLDRESCRAAKAAGLRSVSVSIDGLEATHDGLRAVRGSYQRARACLEHVSAAGMAATANTQLNRRNLAELPALAEVFIEAGIAAWQVQLTGPLGRAADRPELLLQPYELLDVARIFAELHPRLEAAGIQVQAGNNLGYFGPHHKALRPLPFGGCQAGRYLLGIEANGDIKGCPSLPSRPYVAGNVREQPLADLLVAPLTQRASSRTTAELWGECARCYYADICKGGCTWTSHAALGRPGNMPWCVHRAEVLRERGRRERVELVRRAPGEPFDMGLYKLIEEDWPAG